MNRRDEEEGCGGQDSTETPSAHRSQRKAAFSIELALQMRGELLTSTEEG